MAASMMSSQYSQQAVQYPYMAPPSPPMDETSKCSLPSISNLLVCAGQGSPTAESFPAAQQQQQQSQAQPQPVQAGRSGTSAQYGAAAGGHVKTALPPSPPMGNDVRFDQGSPARSMSRLSTGSNATSSTGSYYFETAPGMGQADVDPRSMAAASIPRAAASMQATPAFQNAAAFMQPGMASAYFPSMQPGAPQAAQMPGMYYQRPLPQTFPQMSMPMGLGASAGPNPWHHHYMTTPAQPSYPQSHDRYICQTCHKAFSRPSSLRIHTHSHTGEKPFRCPARNCGKAFSVRSNMKRHLRGCHQGENDNDSQSVTSSRAGSSIGSADSPGPL